MAAIDRSNGRQNESRKEGKTMHKELFEDIHTEHELLIEMIKSMGDYSMEEIIEASTKIPMISFSVLSSILNALKYIVNERERIMEQQGLNTFE
jgi:hypothetical protein